MTREEAIKTIRLTCPKISDSECDFETAMRFLIPELAESEDERIRKEIISALKFANDGGVYDKHIAYLEKQKEQKNYRKLYEDIAKSEWFKKAYKDKSLGCNDEQEEQKPAEWSYPCGRNETADRLISLAECLEMDGDCLFDGYSGTECGKFLRELARKQVECKPADRFEEAREKYRVEWSDEDERMLKSTIWHISNSVTNGKNTDCKCDLTEWLKEKLKSLRSQLSDEDIKKIRSEEYTKGFNDAAFGGKAWKPSNEQMGALYDCIEWEEERAEDIDFILKSLYNDLKKLM